MESLRLGSINLPPPLTPPHKGEGELPHAKSPSPLWGGVRGGGVGHPLNFEEIA